MRIEHITFVRDFKVSDCVMFPGIQQVVFVCRQVFAQVHIIGVAAQAGAIVWLDNDGPLGHL